MKVMIRKTSTGQLSAYIPKKDLEEPITEIEKAEMWGGQITLANGWKLQLPSFEIAPSLPLTVEARRLSE